MRRLETMRIAGYISIPMIAMAGLPVSVFAAEPQSFQFEQQAQKHCPSDTVVWAEATAQLYNVKGERWYGATKSGAYVCRLDGEKVGYRARRRSGHVGGAK